MNGTKMNAAKYVGAAMAVGGSVLLGSAMLSSGPSLKKKAKKTADRAIDAMDAFFAGMQNLLK